jgi:hypothetical protein
MVMKERGREGGVGSECLPERVRKRPIEKGFVYQKSYFFSYPSKAQKIFQ